MALLERYLQGEHLQVCNEILAMGEDAFYDGSAVEVHDVLVELFSRVADNLQIIYHELALSGYGFKKEFKYNFEKPLHQPLEGTDQLLNELDRLTKPFGYVPSSLKYFYTVVGGVNFAWDYDTKGDPVWPLADPIQIASIDEVLGEVSTDYWAEDITQYFEDEEFGCAFLDLSADALHKDNISGGPAYSIEITSKPSVDGRLLNEPHNTTFIDYLRICIDHCGFPGITDPNSEPTFRVFYEKVKPQLKPF